MFILDFNFFENSLTFLLYVRDYDISVHIVKNLNTWKTAHCWSVVVAHVERRRWVGIWYSYTSHEKKTYVIYSVNEWWIKTLFFFESITALFYEYFILIPVVVFHCFLSLFFISLLCCCFIYVYTAKFNGNQSLVMLLFALF